MLRSLALLVLLSALGFRVYSDEPLLLAASMAWAAAVAGIHYRMEKTGRFAFHRTFFFVGLAFFFLVNMHLSVRTEDGILPYCHLSLAGNAMHLGYSQYLSVVNDVWFKYGALSVGVFWLLVVLVNGGGFCGWVCFFGGVDDALSQVLKKPLFRIPGGARTREFQLAVLIFMAFVSFSYMEPAFCLWACPFKIEGAILNQNSPLVGMQMASYIFIGVVFLLVLPVLTRKRTFCNTICPFGAIPPLVSGITPYKITVDPKRCIRCGKCVDACPSFAIDVGKKSAATNRYCTRCLRCVGVCPEEAITSTLFHRKASGLLPFVSMAFGGALAIFYVPGAVKALFDLAMSVFS